MLHERKILSQSLHPVNDKVYRLNETKNVFVPEMAKFSLSQGILQRELVFQKEKWDLQKEHPVLLI